MTKCSFGFVGLRLAASFAEAGAEISLLVREAPIAGLRDRPVHVSGLLGDHVIRAGQVEISDAAAPDDRILGSDMLIVTTKAYDVAEALRPFAGYADQPALLMLQNGLGSAEIARDVMGPDAPVYSTAMMIGMVRNAPNDVAVTAQSSPILCGPLLGDDPEPLERMLDVATKSFVPIVLDPSIRETVAFKLLFNSSMNPIGAMTGQTYGELLENAHSRAFITGLADETLAAFAAAYDYRPARDGRQYVEEILWPIIFPRSQGHRSSMLQDLEAGRKTEIDFLNGAIVRLAKGEGLTATRHESVRALVLAREKALSGDGDGR